MALQAGKVLLVNDMNPKPSAMLSALDVEILTDRLTQH